MQRTAFLYFSPFPNYSSTFKVIEKDTTFDLKAHFKVQIGPTYIYQTVRLYNKRQLAALQS